MTGAVIAAGEGRDEYSSRPLGQLNRQQGCYLAAAHSTVHTVGLTRGSMQLCFRQAARLSLRHPPEATGSSSNSSNSWSIRHWKAASTAATLCSGLWEGALVCSFSSAAQRSWGKRSGRVEAHWPHLMKAGPGGQGGRGEG